MDNRPADFASPGRLHALDNLRALMMWLGIVLHVAVIHMQGPTLLPWRDERRTVVADLLVAFIHSFRMPLFFILAGYFLALLLQSRGPRAAAAHRLRRLALPFALFWPLLFVSAGVLAMVFLHRVERGTWGFDPQLRPRGPAIPEGPATMHLWFLWLLIWFSLAACALASVTWAPWRRACEAGGRLLQALGRAWWGFLVLTLPLVAIGWNYRDGLVTPSGLFWLPLAEWLHNGLFFVFGLALFHHQWALFDTWRRRWPAYALAGLPFFLATGALMARHAPAGWTAFVYNACTWLWSFALLGAALRFAAGRSRVLAYLADSSYWVYLVHMPLTIGFGAVLYGLPLPALAKMLLNIGATTAVCLAAYHVAVRSTWVGALLNGKRQPRPSFSGVPAHAASS
jgi:hypothetical protein